MGGADPGVRRNQPPGAGGAGVQPYAPQGGVERSERLDAGEHAPTIGRRRTPDQVIDWSRLLAAAIPAGRQPLVWPLVLLQRVVSAVQNASWRPAMAAAGAGGCEPFEATADSGRSCRSSGRGERDPCQEQSGQSCLVSNECNWFQSVRNRNIKRVAAETEGTFVLGAASERL